MPAREVAGGLEQGQDMQHGSLSHTHGNAACSCLHASSRAKASHSSLCTLSFKACTAIKHLLLRASDHHLGGHLGFLASYAAPEEAALHIMHAAPNWPAEKGLGKPLAPEQALPLLHYGGIAQQLGHDGLGRGGRALQLPGQQLGRGGGVGRRDAAIGQQLRRLLLHLHALAC